MTDIENSSRHVSYEQVKQMIDFMGQQKHWTSRFPLSARKSEKKMQKYN